MDPSPAVLNRQATAALAWSSVLRGCLAESLSIKPERLARHIALVPCCAHQSSYIHPYIHPFTHTNSSQEAAMIYLVTSAIYQSFLKGAHMMGDKEKPT